MIVEEITNPVDRAQMQARRERFAKNSAWLEANAKEVYRHRGKMICIAGQELFVGDSVAEVVARAKAAHPEDDGFFTRYIPASKAARIYAYRWLLACL
jgi:hypothetical protein